MNDVDAPIVDDEPNLDDVDIPIDIYDPRNWDALDSKMIDVLAIKGPNRDLTFKKGPKDKFGRRFLSSCYIRTLSNGEKCNREWLVYAKELDKVFCFCCKLFNKGSRKGKIVNEGFDDWSHLCNRLTEHEISMEHLKNMATWYELRLRFNQGETIDKSAQKQMERRRSIGKMF